jgi:hypothetical protein
MYLGIAETKRKKKSRRGKKMKGRVLVEKYYLQV